MNEGDRTEWPDHSVERAAALLGLLVVGLVSMWMATIALQRPLTYAEAAVTATWPVMRINVNTATEAELTVLPRIGPHLARRIVEDREMNGPFTSLDDLQRVPMIGPRTIEQIEEHVIVRRTEKRSPRSDLDTFTAR